MGSKRNSRWLAWLVFGLACAFYFYEYLLQVSPSVMTTELMRDFSIEAKGLGIVSAFFYYAYAPMQPVGGVLLDKYGPRKILFVATLVCSLGAVWFGLTNSVVAASMGRFLIGFGSAFSYTSILVLAAKWFPLHHFAMLAGLAQALSSIGAIFGQLPFEIAVAHFEWRNSLVFLGVIGVLLAVAIWLVVRDEPGEKSPSKDRAPVKALEGLQSVLTNKQTWLVGIYSLTIWSSIALFAALWGVPYLRIIMDNHGLPTTYASLLISLLWIGVALSSPLVGWWSDRIGKRCLPLAIVALIGLVATLAIILVPSMPVVLLALMLFLFGVAMGGQSLTFGLVKDNNQLSAMGAAMGVNNMLVVLGGAILQPLAGVILSYRWDGTTGKHGVPVYSLLDYQYALGVVPVCFFIASVMALFFLRESYCRPQSGQGE